MVHETHAENVRDLIHDLLATGEVTQAVSVLANRHPADQADILEHLDRAEIVAVLGAFAAEQAADVLEHLHVDRRDDVLSIVPSERLASILDAVDDDIEADILQNLPAERARELLPLLQDRAVVEELIAYDEDSAGGLMSPDVLKLKGDWTVDETIDFLRTLHPDSAQPYYLYVVDDGERLLGVVSMREIVVSPPNVRLAEIMSPDVISIPASSDREQAAERMRHYNLLALPVLDSADRLRGVITADSVLDIQVEEATEDMFKMAGIGVKEHAFSPVLESAGRRVPWLAFNMAWAFAGALIISVFEGTLERAAVLAVFMPMIAGQCGNAGIQTATIVVRSMALGEVDTHSMARLLRKEWILGAIKGVLFGGILALVAWVWKGNPVLGAIAGTSMFANMLIASTAGVVVPLTLRRMGIDPATIAGVFDTMLTDLMGFLIYLGLATLLISHLT